MIVKSVLAGKSVTGVVSIGAQETLTALAARLREIGVGALVVVDADEALIGVISERDVVRALADDGPTALSAPISKYMTREVQTAGPNDTAVSVLERMTRGRFRHMPVVEHGRMIGLVSIGDVVKARIDGLRADNAALEEFIRS